MPAVWSRLQTILDDLSNPSGSNAVSSLDGAAPDTTLDSDAAQALIRRGKVTPLFEWAPWADSDQAAALTVGRGLRSSNCCGLIPKALLADYMGIPESRRG